MFPPPLLREVVLYVTSEAMCLRAHNNVRLQKRPVHALSVDTGAQSSYCTLNSVFCDTASRLNHEALSENKY